MTDSLTRLHAHPTETSLEALLAADAEEWKSVDETVIPLEPSPLDRQPSAYVQAAWRERPRSQSQGLCVRAAANDAGLALRLDWSAPRPQRFISDVNVYPDACAVVFPADGTEAEFHTMGSSEHPVRAWHWRAGDDAPFVITATGIGTAERVPEHGVQARARWSDGRWQVVLARSLAAGGVPLARGSIVPVAFAIWSGTARERAGVKSFSPRPCELRIG
jgi:DMSO reductase family type II enzyme heme b subunit